MNKSMAEQFIDDDLDQWEDGALGNDADHAVISASINEDALDEALCLQSITIRIQKGLLDDLKTIATLEGIGYQPLMKQALQRFVTCEMKRRLREEADKIEARKLMKADIEEGDYPHRRQA